MSNSLDDVEEIDTGHGEVRTQIVVYCMSGLLHLRLEVRTSAICVCPKILPPTLNIVVRSGTPEQAETCQAQHFQRTY